MRMVARGVSVEQGLVQGLRAEESSMRMKSLKAIKNQVIGNKSKKLSFIKAGAVGLVLALLGEEDSELQVQSAVTLGSFACGTEEGLHQLLEHAGVHGLVGALSSKSPRVVEAAMRALKMVFTQAGGRVPNHSILEPDRLALLLSLLRDLSRPDVAESAALILAHCCTSEAEQWPHDGRRAPDPSFCTSLPPLPQQRLLMEAGLVEAGGSLLMSDRKPLQTAALHLLSRLLADNPPACQQLLLQGEAASAATACPLDALLKLLRDREPLVRFMAATCLTHVASSGQEADEASSMDADIAEQHCPSGSSGSGDWRPQLASGMASEAAQPSCLPRDAVVSRVERLERAKAATLPVLLRLLSESGMLLERVPPVLAKLIEFSGELQKAALDADAVRHLALLLTQPAAAKPASPATTVLRSSSAAAQSTSRPATSAAAVEGPAAEGPAVDRRLTGLAPACSLQEGVLKALSSLCMEQSDGRKQLVEAKVMKHIVMSLEHPDSGVRAAAAKCVMALSRSIPNLRGAVLEAEVVVVLCRMLNDESDQVQVNAAGALCNLGLDFSSVKDTVVSSGALGPLLRMTGSATVNVRVQGCWALRNLVYRSDDAFKREVMAAVPWARMRQLMDDCEPRAQEHAVCSLRNLCMGSEQNIQAVLDWGGADLMACLEEKMDPSSGAPSIVMEHSLYTVVNLLTGGERQKEAVMDSNIPALLAHHLRSPTSSQEHRVPALWCIINLAWLEGSTSAGVAGRVRKLRALGVEEQLRALLHERDRDVSERAQTALDRFEAADSEMLLAVISGP